MNLYHNFISYLKKTFFNQFKLLSPLVNQLALIQNLNRYQIKLTPLQEN